MKPREAAILYVAAKKVMTNCMQKEFKQLCTRCKYYQRGTCETYNTYVQAWIDLQRSIE